MVMRKLKTNKYAKMKALRRSTKGLVVQLVNPVLGAERRFPHAEEIAGSNPAGPTTDSHFLSKNDML